MRRKQPDFNYSLPLPFSLEWNEEAALWVLDTQPSMRDIRIPGLLHEEYNTGREIRVFGHERLKAVIEILQAHLDSVLQSMAIPFETGLGHTAYAAEGRYLIRGRYTDQARKFLGISEASRRGLVAGEMAVRNEPELRAIEAVLHEMSESPDPGPDRTLWLRKGGKPSYDLPGFHSWNGPFVDVLGDLPAFRDNPNYALTPINRHWGICVAHWLEPVFVTEVRRLEELCLEKQSALALDMERNRERLSALPAAIELRFDQHYLLLTAPSNTLNYIGAQRHGFSQINIYLPQSKGIAVYGIPITPASDVTRIRTQLDGMVKYVVSKFRQTG